MPPKAEITKEKVLDASFEIAREQGLEVLTARSIATKLKCSTQPIYSAYGSMEELKDDVYSRAIDFAITSMRQYEDDKNSPAMKLVLGCLLFAQNEKQLFRTIYLSDYRKYYLTRYEDRINEEIYTAFLQLDDRLSLISESKVKTMFLKLMAYWLGISTMINTNMLSLEIEEATEMVEEMYQALSIREGLE
ncbi:AcrR family transcriptional regulator [Paenibacillus cellulosilyticus]|uniref:AcrR family transcriptional regulator n=2 Tax=Paenibacillus cellulosilyticus TaxID=375489 RepID=A0A2V2YYV5_9BACL|nr:TetR/AcrR family transcriptional regulator [Paenibacillus cellulosilyticus]PWW07319.1 AcrR family transcriptional regulator [Paenibacillus cellulosilyticus]QKS46457.1 TetR/AcrR family transcriptional regulator [Paenibacillus cellulosilyticus]